MSQTAAQRISALFGLLAVALGAFGAHALKATLAEHQTAAIWETAVFYHMTHAILMFALASFPNFRRGAWICFAVGVAIFSGSLYILGVSGVRSWGMVTPFGGLGLLIGWLILLWPAKRSSVGP